MFNRGMFNQKKFNSSISSIVSSSGISIRILLDSIVDRFNNLPSEIQKRITEKSKLHRVANV